MTFPRKLLIATTNPRKGAEMAQILGAANLGLQFFTLADFPDMPPVEETGETFLENARIKAVAATNVSGLVAIADDGGLVIDALGGQPGVHSHRFLGETTAFPEKMATILERMRDVPEAERTCRFQCAVVIAAPDGQTASCMGTCEGRVAYEMRGTYGFGYDPIFLLPELGRHMAELPPEEKHRISHRGKALACAVEALRRLFAEG
ncbi:MAG TPA: RdgB/HAM1 family non-canonical purine NTP pyrophosphatase [Chthonomonadaceae bacterium]|nr:RdgB/HAM1 family non-canonical purine NTP pyrophosphatase [Chthonomonadaceae bacterium]